MSETQAEYVKAFNALTVPSLRARAATAGIVGRSKMNKAGLVDALSDLEVRAAVEADAARYRDAITAGDVPAEEKCLLHHGYVKPCQQDRGHAGECDKETVGLVRKTGVTLLCAKSFVTEDGRGVCAVRQEPGVRGNHEGPHFDDQRRLWSEWAPRDVFKEKYLDALLFMSLLADQLEGSGDNALAADVRKFVRESNEL